MHALFSPLLMHTYILLSFFSSDKSSKRARDLHLLKKLKTAMRNFQAEDVGFGKFVENLFAEIKTPAITQQSLNKLISSSKIPAGVIEDVISAMIAQFSSQGLCFCLIQFVISIFFVSLNINDGIGLIYAASVEMDD